jgi:hypothetical protein
MTRTVQWWLVLMIFALTAAAGIGAALLSAWTHVDVEYLKTLAVAGFAALLALARPSSGAGE